MNVKERCGRGLFSQEGCVTLLLIALFGGCRSAPAGQLQYPPSETKAWLDSKLAPLLSTEFEVFKKECIELSTLLGRGRRTPVYSSPREDWELLDEERIRILRWRMRGPDPDPRVVVCALRAARSWNLEFKDQAIGLLQSPSREVQDEAIRLLVPSYPFEFGGQLERNRKLHRYRDTADIVEVLIQRFMGDTRERDFACTGTWGVLLSDFQLTEEERHSLLHLAKQFISSRNWEARFAAADLLSCLEYHRNEALIMQAFRQEHVLQALRAARRQGAEDPAIVAKAITYARVADQMASLAAEKAATYSARARELLAGRANAAGLTDKMKAMEFTFTAQDAQFWRNNGLDERLCEALLEAGRAARTLPEKDPR